MSTDSADGYRDSNISAYRIGPKDSAFDDDGESGAGIGLANLLESMEMSNW